MTPATNLLHHAQLTSTLNYTPSRNSTTQHTNTTLDKRDYKSENCKNKVIKNLKTNDKRTKKHNRMGCTGETLRNVLLGPLHVGCECAQRRPTPRPSEERICRKALAETLRRGRGGAGSSGEGELVGGRVERKDKGMRGRRRGGNPSRKGYITCNLRKE